MGDEFTVVGPGAEDGAVLVAPDALVGGALDATVVLEPDDAHPAVPASSAIPVEKLKARNNRDP